MDPFTPGTNRKKRSKKEISKAKKPEDRIWKSPGAVRMKAINDFKRVETAVDPMDLGVETSGDESDRRRQTRSQTKKRS